MHPITARFLSFSSAKKTLLLIRKGMPLDAEECCFAKAAQDKVEFATRILESKSNKPEAVQRALFWLSLKAALISLKQDDTFLPEFSKTEAALREEGATAEQTESLFLSALFEEAYESEHDFSEFDAAFVLESIQTLFHLATLSEEKLGNAAADFNKYANNISADSLKAFHTFFNTFFEEGLELPCGKHIEILCAHSPSMDTAELGTFLDFLEARHIIGPLRKQKLLSKPLPTQCQET